MLCSTTVALLIYLNVNLRRVLISNHLQRANEMRSLVASWHTRVPQSLGEPEMVTTLTRGILPVPCHSHNDYWRRIPLYEALAAGCTGIEADVWLHGDDLLVGHTMSSLTVERSLDDLYIDPIKSILTIQDQAKSRSKLENKSRSSWIFEMSGTTSLNLLIDVKSNGRETTAAVLDHLEPLRSKGWLTHFNGSRVVSGPITVILTGNAPFDMISSNDTYRDVFFDAPLDDLEEYNSLPDGTHYTAENSLYASVSFQTAIGKVHGSLSSQQVKTIRQHVKNASRRSLKLRYWDTPAWPVSIRNYVWEVLEREGVGMLNVDDVYSASKEVW